ncbi:MAG: RNA-binding protein [Pseudobdellovibrio sp.]|jgi:RNA recognition motif-containing protein|nr:RNA-binding protein [Pseudobdellovibrio sp.]
MGKKIYVGNLAFTTSEENLESMFSVHGKVESAKLVIDRESGRSKGFAFVEMSSDAEAQTVIEKLNGTEQFGRNLKISIAKPMAPKENRGSTSLTGFRPNR